MRDKTITRDFWNFFTGDEENKTDFFLQFKNEFTNIQYKKHLISSSLYSLRFLLLALSIADIYIVGFNGPHVLILTLSLLVVSLIDASNQFINRIPYFIWQTLMDIAKNPNKSIFFINLVPMCLTYNLLHLFIDNLMQTHDCQQRLNEISLTEGSNVMDSQYKIMIERNLTGL